MVEFFFLNILKNHIFFKKLIVLFKFIYFLEILIKSLKFKIKSPVKLKLKG